MVGKRKEAYIARAGKVQCPVVMAIARSRPSRRAVDFRVGDGDTPTRSVAENNMLATNERCCHMVNPYHISYIQCNGIPTPDISRVEIGDVNILYNDIADTVGHA